LLSFLVGLPFARGELHHTTVQSERDVLRQLFPVICQNRTEERLGGRILGVNMTSCQVWDDNAIGRLLFRRMCSISETCCKEMGQKVWGCLMEPAQGTVSDIVRSD
jgi:hypothetical protein